MHLPAYWIDRRLYEYLTVNIGLRVSSAVPILVYQMGKVGSSSVRNSLFRSRDARTAFVFMSHEYLPVRNRRLDRLALLPRDRDALDVEVRQARAVYERFPPWRRLTWRFREHLYLRQIYEQIIRRGRPAKIITLVRDPVAANLSMFFQIIDHYLGEPYVEGRWSVEELAAGFLRTYPHVRPVLWFDVEFAPTTGVDVYSHAFPREAGVQSITRGPLEVLILKCEQPDEVKADAIARFIGLPSLTLVRSNTAASKPYARQYEAVRQALDVPDSLLDEMYESRFARHFYTDGERQAFRARWGRHRHGG